MKDDNGWKKCSQAVKKYWSFRQKYHSSTIDFGIRWARCLLNRTLHFSLLSALRLNPFANLLYCSHVRVTKVLLIETTAWSFFLTLTVWASSDFLRTRSLQQCISLWRTNLASWPDTSILEHKLCKQFQGLLYTEIRKSIKSVYTYFWPQKKKMFCPPICLSSLFSGKYEKLLSLEYIQLIYSNDKILALLM